ncbi:MAG: YqzE-like protein [Paenibacillus sp.]|jgi:hypothetical protein|uniref:YqzE family protein n=1 Tax=Paenibacillus sp. GYB004 TaxID=2994393 RepID=UPI0029F22587|nr:YqzE-like protein [Paenibacillus sp.]
MGIRWVSVAVFSPPACISRKTSASGRCEATIASKTEDYIKYLTERVVAYMDTPPEVRKEQRILHKSTRMPWHVRWFGMIPLSIAIWWKRRRERKAQRQKTTPHDS